MKGLMIFLALVLGAVSTGFSQDTEDFSIALSTAQNEARHRRITHRCCIA